jgi:hypothetical protein
MFYEDQFTGHAALQTLAASHLKTPASLYRQGFAFFLSMRSA